MVSNSNPIENTNSAELSQPDLTPEQLLDELHALRQYVAQLEQQLGYSEMHPSPIQPQRRYAGASPTLPVEFQEVRDLAETAYRIKNEFLAVLSHELRSPLNPILGWTQMLRSHQLSPEMTHRALDAIERNAKLQAQLIEDLLDVSQILQGKLKLNITSVNLQTVIEAAIDTVHHAAASKAIDLSFICTAIDPAQPLKIMGDPDRLQQIVWNLLANAVKFTPSGGKIVVSLTTSASEQFPEQFPEPEQTQKQAQQKPPHSATDSSDSLGQPYALIQVCDTGKGIDPTFLPHIFEYFRQADSTITRQFGGLGLGLTIVRHLVELHGGSIAAESAGEGQGTIFRVWLPRFSTKAPQQNFPKLTDPRVSHLAGLLRDRRVLIVDDNIDMRSYLEFVLQQASATVATACSAGEVLTKLPRFQPDILISDLSLPGVDGYRLLRQIRSLVPELGGNVPAIALIDYAGEYDQQQIAAAGFQYHLTKPIDPSALVTAVNRLIADPAAQQD